MKWPSKCWVRATVFWEPAWGSRRHFQGGSLTRLASWCWLLAGGLSSSPHRPLHKLFKCSCSMIAGFFQWSKKEQTRNQQFFHDLTLEVILCYNSLLVTKVSPIQCKRGYTRTQIPGCENHWRPFASWPPTLAHPSNLNKIPGWLVGT